MAADESALAAGFAWHRDRLFSVLRFRIDRRLALRVDAEDLLQEAYLRAVKRLSYFASDHASHSQNGVFLWLRRIVLQTLWDAHRQHLGAKKRDVRLEVGLDGNGSPVATSVFDCSRIRGRTDVSEPSCCQGGNLPAVAHSDYTNVGA